MQKGVGPSAARLQELSYRDWPFVFCLRVSPDGSAQYEASFNCIGATPEPGQVGCQHRNGSLTKQQVDAIWSTLCSKGLEKYSSAREPAFGPGGCASLDFKADGKSFGLSESEQTRSLFTTIRHLQPGQIRQQLESKSAREQRALK